MTFLRGPNYNPYRDPLPPKWNPFFSQKNSQLTWVIVFYFDAGDVGYYDKNGVVFIVDRIKELIKYKAFQVSSLLR